MDFGKDYPIVIHCVKSTYCAVYNLTERRFVAPFENLTFLGLRIGGTRRRLEWRNWVWRDNPSGIICDRFTTATARRGVKRRARCWKNSLGSAAITASTPSGC